MPPLPRAVHHNPCNLGAAGAVPGGLGVVEGDELPYKPEALCRGGGRWPSHNRCSENRPDNPFGGLLFGIGNGFWEGLARLAGPESVPPWRYESPAIHATAQAPDGHIYALESRDTGRVNTDGSPIRELQAIVLDGSTGVVVKRMPLEPEVWTLISNNNGVGSCNSSRTEGLPEFVGPVIGVDGYGYLLVRRHTRTLVSTCNENGTHQSRDVQRGIVLLKLSPNGILATQVVRSDQCSVLAFQANCDSPATLLQVVPDLIGGTVVLWQYRPTGQPLETHMTRFDENGAATDRVVPASTSISLMGDMGTAYGMNDGVRAAMDVVT